MDKAAFRSDSLRKRSAITNKAEKDAKITAKIIQYLQDTAPASIGIYMSFGDEVHTIEIIRYCFLNGIYVAVPKIEKGTMEFYWINSFSDVAEGHFKVMEPTTKKIAQKVDVQFVPMLAFDVLGNRIGYGKGYYDRYLTCFDGKVIGLAYEEQRSDAVPTEPHDQKIDCIVTEINEYCRNK